MNLLRRVGRFWYDFLVGDRWELFIGPIVVLVVAWALVTAGVAPAITGLVLFAGVCVIGAISVVRQSA